MGTVTRCFGLALLWLCLPALGEAAFGETFPHIANAILGRGFNLNSKTIKEYMLRQNYKYEVVNVTKSVSKYNFIEDDSDVSKVLDVSGEIKFGINAGFSLNIDGRAHYVRDSGIKKDDIQMLFSLSVLDFYEIAPNIEVDGREDCAKLTGDAGSVTHVVGGILYGAQCTVSVVWRAKSAAERRKIMGELNLQLGMKGKFNLEVGGNVQFNNSEQKATHNYDLKASCNMEIGKYPKSMQDIASFTDSLPKLYFEKKQKGEARGIPISMYLVPISEVAACKSLAVEDKPAIPPAPTVVDFFFTEMENMLEDFGAAEETLSRCRRMYPLRSINDAAIFNLESAFYRLSRALDRRAVLLKEQLVVAQNADEVQWSDPNQLLAFAELFEQKYFDFVVSPADKAVTDLISGLGDQVRTVSEGSKWEDVVRIRRSLVGNKVWRMRAEGLCAERHQLSATWREEF